jgi:putative sterol carrier protein
MDPAAVYATTIALSDDEFAGVMSDPARRPEVLDAIVAHMVAGFRGENAGDLDAVIQIKLWDRPGGGYDHFELVIHDGACAVSDSPTRDADLTLKIRPSDLRALVAGTTGPRRLVFKRRMTVLGDLKLGTRLPDLFSSFSSS